MDSNTKLQNKLDKWEQKSDRYKASVSKLEMKSQALNDKQDKPLKSYTVVLYSDNDKMTGESKAHFRLDSTVTTKSQHEKNKPRGMLHKLDAHIKTENIGFVVPVIQKDKCVPLANGAINANAGRRTISLHNKALPSVLQDAVPYTKRTLLAAESAVIKAGDSFKHTAQPVAMAATNALKMQVSNQIYKAAQENTGLKATMGAANATISTAQMVHKWSSNRRQYMIAQKGLKLEQKTELMKAKVEKLEMKSAMAKEKHVYKELRKSAKENGLDLKFTRAEKKKAWKKVFDNAQKGNYLEKPQMKSFQKASKADVLAAKEFKAAKQVYHTKIVKEKVFNTATGRTQTKYHRVIDKSRKKVQKPKKPDDFFVSASKMGLGALGNKATAELANSDDVGTQALGKGLQFGMSELSKANQKRTMQSKLKFDRKMSKAQMKMEKAHNELQIEKSKPEQPKLKKKDKKAMKKAAAKNRNAKQFKENLKQKAKKLKEKAATKVKELVKKKMLPALIGVGGGVVIMLLIMMLPILLLGGNTDTGAVIGVASYTTDRATLIEMNTEFQNLVWEWQQEFNNKVNEVNTEDTAEWELILTACFPTFTSNCPNAAESLAAAAGNHAAAVANGTCPPGNVYEVIKNLGSPNTIVPTCDMRYIYAYYTVKYKDEEWPSIEAEFGDFFEKYYEFKEITPYFSNYHNSKQLIDVHTSESCVIKDGKHSHSSEEEEHYEEVTKKIIYYRFQPKNGDDPYTIEEYILDQVKNIGEKDSNGISEGQKHYEMLLESLGLTQVISYPVYYPSTGEPMDWSEDDEVSFFGEIAEFKDINTLIPEEQRDPNALEDYRFLQLGPVDTYLTLPWVEETIEIVAGGYGVITEKTDTSITINYEEENLSVRYEGVARTAVAETSPQISGMTSLEVGDKVEEGTHLFYNEPFFIENWGDVQASLRLTTYDTEAKAYINPFYVVQSRIH